MSVRDWSIYIGHFSIVALITLLYTELTSAVNFSAIKPNSIMGSSSSSSSSHAGGTQDDREPELGDLIEIFRDNYQHWAVYVGAGFVVHFVVAYGGSISTSDQTANGNVLKEKLFNVVGRDKWKVNNDLDRKYNPRPANVIVKKANAMVGKQLQYDLASYNCEHFVNELRYGAAVSRQVQTAATVGGIGLIGSLAVVSMASKTGPSSY